MPEANEIWQVEVNGAVYDAAFGELPEWIDGGSLLPGDKVRKGNLRWIEARRVPALLPFFNAKERGERIPVAVTVTEPETLPEMTPVLEPPVQTENVSSFTDEAFLSEPDSTRIAGFDPTRCAIHLELESFFLCDGCANGFCKACPTSYGSSVKICPMCGAMCKRADEARAAQQKILSNSAKINAGFGSGDFVRALGHPFNFKASLFLGGMLFAFFTIGQAAGSMGNIFLVAAALISGMLANMLTFGVLSNTVDKFVQGKLDANFFPDFEDFELWDDVVHPFFLSIAAYVVAFGPFLITLAIGFYLVTNAVNSTAKAIQSDLERIPGTNVYAGRELADQSNEVKDVLAKIDAERAEKVEMAANRAAAESLAADADQFAANSGNVQVVDEESRQQEELWAAATESRKQSLESVVGKTPETREREREEMIKEFLGLAAPLVVVGFITLLFGALFFPAACAVAGYSKSFAATINPLVVFDTLRRLGGDYVKLLFFGSALLITAVITSGLLHFVFAPFDLPGLGNIPAIGIGALFTFYFWAVFSCVIGYLLFKKGDKLGLLK